MADNVAITAGAGTNIASDDIAGVHYQRVKAVWGSDGTATDIDATNRLPVVSTAITKIINATLTRPADGTAYAANDEISNSTTAPTIIDFANCARATGGSGVIVGVSCIQSTNAATKPVLELWLFDSTSTPNNDNAAYTPSDAVAQTVIAIIPFQAPFSGDPATGGNCVHDSGALSIPYVAVGTSLFGRLVVRNAYTPTSAETFTFRLKIQQD